MNNCTPIKQEIRKIFDYFAISSTFTQESLRNIILTLSESNFIPKANLSSLTKQAFAYIDSYGNGSLTFSQFYERCLSWFDLIDMNSIFGAKISYEESLIEEVYKSKGAIIITDLNCIYVYCIRRYSLETINDNIKCFDTALSYRLFKQRT